MDNKIVEQEQTMLAIYALSTMKKESYTKALPAFWSDIAKTFMRCCNISDND